MHQQDTQTDDQIHPYELLQLSDYYKTAPAGLRALAWNLLQTALTPQNKPTFLAFALAMDLLENEECREYHKAQGEQEDFPTREEAAASFWRGHLGFTEGSLSQNVPEAQRDAITSAALALVALAPAKVSASDASKERGSLPEATPAKKIIREREATDTEEQLARV